MSMNTHTFKSKLETATQKNLTIIRQRTTKIQLRAFAKMQNGNLKDIWIHLHILIFIIINLIRLLSSEIQLMINPHLLSRV